jgi:xanthine dehydrogenase molybdopterin-binding subunit B
VREFLKSSGALIVSFSSAATLADDLAFAQGPFGTQDRRVARQLDSWIAVGADGRVTAYTGKCELGQGTYTVQMQLVAEELSVPADHCSTGREIEEPRPLRAFARFSSRDVVDQNALQARRVRQRAGSSRRDWPAG